jgi:hypothetical protein
MSQSASISIYRKKSFSYSVRAFNIILNNQKLGSIKNGETRSFNLEPGSYALSVKIDMYSTETMQFNLISGDTFSFETGVNSGVGGVLSAFTSSEGYLFLKQTAGTVSAPSPIEPIPVQPPAKNLSKPETKPAAANNAIFISYRRQDSPDTTGRIYDRLAQRFGQDSVFKDIDSIPLGVDFRKHLDASVGKCKVLLAVIGDNWHDKKANNGKSRFGDPRDFVRIEIESALKRDIAVIPLLVRGAQMPGENDLPESMIELSYRNGIPVRPDPDFHNDIERLMEGLEEILNN